MQNITDTILKHQQIDLYLLENMQSHIYTAKIILSEAIKKNQKIYIFGNGVNAILANMMVYMLNTTYHKDISFSLCSDNAAITYLGNEFGFDYIFEKQVSQKVAMDDVLIGLSNSGVSKNILRALSLGHNLGCKTIGFSGKNGGAMYEFCDVNISIPDLNTVPTTAIFCLLENLIPYGNEIVEL